MICWMLLGVAHLFDVQCSVRGFGAGISVEGPEGLELEWGLAASH